MHQITLYVIGENAIYFDSFGVEYIAKRIKEFIEKKKYYSKYSQNASNEG